MKKRLGLLLALMLPFFAYAEVYENIVIKVNNKIVNRYEIEKFRNILQATMGQNMPLEQAKKQLSQILILEYFTEENNIEIGDKDVSREISEIAERMKLGGERQIREALAAQYKISISSDDLRDFIRKQLVFKKSQEFLILNKKRNEITKPTEQQVVDFYNAQKRHFIAPAEVKIAHLVMLSSKDLSFKEQLAIEKKLNAIKAECLKIKDVKKREEMFYKKVEQEASPIFRKNKGYLGSFDPEKLRALFPQYLKVFELRKGEITDVIATENSRQIVFLAEKKGGEILELSQIRDRIENILMMQQGEKIFVTWMDEYSKKFKITIN